jgi:DNA-binding transcriptional ArsR family regulator
VDAQIKALAEPRRRQILELVRDQELAAGEIAAHFEVTRPAISQHLTVLKEASLITERRDGARRLYRVDPTGLLVLKQFVDAFWGSGLKGSRPKRRQKQGRAGADRGRDVDSGDHRGPHRAADPHRSAT